MLLRCTAILFLGYTHLFFCSAAYSSLFRDCSAQFIVVPLWCSTFPTLCRSMLLCRCSTQYYTFLCLRTASLFLCASHLNIALTNQNVTVTVSCVSFKELRFLQISMHSLTLPLLFLAFPQLSLTNLFLGGSLRLFSLPSVCLALLFVTGPCSTMAQLCSSLTIQLLTMPKHSTDPLFHRCSHPGFSAATNLRAFKQPPR